MQKREIAAHLLGVGALGELLRRTSIGDGLLVLNYHRIGDPSASLFDPALFSATADAFEAHVRVCKQSFDVVSPGDLPRIRGARGRYVQITFDDGYRDNYDVAFPILARHGVPATFFLATGLID